jgi:hypothetical protein
MSKIEQIAGTVVRLAKPGLKSRELTRLVRKEHPKASKGEITRGAFYAMIVSVEDKLDDRAAELHGAAMELRSSGEGES